MGHYRSEMGSFDSLDSPEAQESKRLLAAFTAEDNARQLRATEAMIAILKDGPLTLSQLLAGLKAQAEFTIKSVWHNLPPLPSRPSPVLLSGQHLATTRQRHLALRRLL